MYTQCPECQVTFKVTAEVLQQARGRVRCGNCGEAFNALDHLSESAPMPQALAPPDPESERKSQELLNTLDQLTGPEEVRIEDTGIEWRVVDEETGEPAAGTGSTESVDTAETLGDGDIAAPDYVPDEAEEELRYDDNTPLPDDFAEEPEDDGHLVYAEAPESFEFTEPAENEPEDDLDLSEPDEWTDLLDEVEIGDEDSPEAIEARREGPEADAPDAGEDDAAEAAEDDGDEAQSEQSDEEFADEAESEEEPPAESAIPYDSPDEDEAADVDADDEFEFAADEDLEIEFDDDGDELAAAADGDEDAEDAEVQAEDDSEATLADGEGEPVDEDEPVDKAPAEADEEEVVSEDMDADDELEWAADDGAADAESSDEGERAEEDEVLDAGSEDEEDPLTETSGEFERAIASAEEQEEDAEAELFEDPVTAAEDEEPDESDQDEATDEVQDDIAAMTANMQIDPDVIRAMREGDFDGAMTNEDGSPMVETIIMEGDAVRDAIEAADTGEQKTLEGGDPVSLLDTYISTRKPEKTSAAPRILMIVGGVVLALVLAGQYIHSQRETLATQSWFATAIAPIYTSLGMPVTPDWDIKGWQFEATSGSTGGSSGDLLTISSRVSNRSSQTLPYPLVHVSLTDRYQEVIGSRILEPGEYLADGAGSGGGVAAGGNFTATITIAETSAEATGFNLNVCYPEPGGRVRCAIEDFKER